MKLIPVEVIILRDKFTYYINPESIVCIYPKTIIKGPDLIEDAYFLLAGSGGAISVRITKESYDKVLKLFLQRDTLNERS